MASLAQCDVRILDNFSSNLIQRKDIKQYKHVSDIIYMLVCLKHDEHVDDTQTKD